MKNTRPFSFYPLCLMHFILSISALAAGFSFMVEPDGTGIEIDLSYLGRTPFSNFFLPGLILFLFNGIFPLVILIGLIFRPFWKAINFLNIYKDKHWAWTYSLYSGIILILWITIQSTMTDYFFLQPVCLGLGTGILILTLLPGMQKYLSVS